MPNQRRSRAQRLFAVSAVAVAALIAWSAYGTFVRARDTADGSCLASIHAALARARIADADSEAAVWRSWSPEEIEQSLKRVHGDYGDCREADQPWPRDLQIRSRRAGMEVELQLWLRGRPHVSSPWRTEGLE
jgi:hypothetical protein